MKERTSHTIKIYSSAGTEIVEATIASTSIRKFTLMKEDYIRLDFLTDEAVHIPIGAYIQEPIFGRFVVTEEQMPRYEESTAGYRYELKMDAEYMKLKNKLFMLTYFNNTTGKRTRREATWNLTSKLSDHLDELINNIDVIAGNQHGYSYDVTGCEKAAEVHTMTYSGTNIIEALNQLAEEWECEWWVAGKTIYMGKCETEGEPLVFALGNESVARMEIQDNRNTYANKVWVLGSDKNLPFSYRKKVILTIKNSFIYAGFKYYKVDKAVTTDMLNFETHFEAPYPVYLGEVKKGVGTKLVAAGGEFVSINRGRYDVWTDYGVHVDGIDTIAVSRTSSTLEPQLKVDVSIYKYRREDSTITIIQDEEFQYDLITEPDGSTKMYHYPGTIFADLDRNGILLDGEVCFGVRVSIVPYNCIIKEDYTVQLSSQVSVMCDINTSEEFYFDCKKGSETIQVGFNNVKKGDPLYSSIFIDGDQNSLQPGDMIEVPTFSNNIPSAFYTTPFDDPSSLLTLGVNRLRMPESIGDFLGDDSSDAVEEIITFDNIYPDGKLYANSVTEEEKKDHTEYEGESTKSDWQWHEYTLDPYIVSSGKKFEFNEDYRLPDTKLQIRFLTPQDVGRTDPGDGFRLAGMTFEVAFSKINKTFTIVRNSDFGALLPNDTLKPMEGDPFVLIGWNVHAMEELGLIEDAERRLLEKAQEYMAALEESQFTFTCTMRSDWMFNLKPTIPYITADNEVFVDIEDRRYMVVNDFDVYVIPKEGTKVEIHHDALQEPGVKTSRVIGYELKLDKPYDTPVYTIGETEAYSRLAKIEKEISNH